jgi:predicted phosphohydrolase
LAGDVVTFAQQKLAKPFFDRWASEFEKVYWLPGNHEFYGFDLSTKQETINEAIRSNLFLVNNIAVELNGLRILFSTLWSQISQLLESIIQRSLNDFHQIRFGDRRLRTIEYNRLHQEARQFLETELKKPFEGKTIVATHHVPTFYNYPEAYKGDDLNEAFATELFDLIADYGPDHWIFGHHHCNMPSFQIGNTWLHTNQMGYVQNGEHHTFDKSAVIQFIELGV